VGLLQSSRSGRSFQVYALDDKGQRVFIGLVSKKALSALLQKQIPQADICKFDQNAAEEKEPLSFSLELKP
jgi:hypothetical protein